MTEADRLRAAIDANPEESTPVMMLADELHAEGGCTFLVAMATALLHQEAALDRLHLVRAAKLLFDSTAAASRLRETIREEWPVSEGVSCFFALMVGNREPHLWTAQALKDGAVIGFKELPNGNYQLVRITQPSEIGLAVLVGAKWVLDFAEDHGFTSSSAAPAKND